KDHHDDAIAKLAVNRLAVIPLTIHESYQATSLARSAACVWGPVQVHVAVNFLISKHECPVFRMVVRVDKREFCVMHVFAQIAARDVEKIELQGFFSYAGVHLMWGYR